jgi:hypothetical protein
MTDDALTREMVEHMHEICKKLQSIIQLLERTGPPIEEDENDG